MAENKDVEKDSKQQKDSPAKKSDQKSEPKKSWFQGLKAEFKRITWPGKKRVARETTAVVISAIILAAITLGVDVLLELGLQNIW